MTLWLCKFIMCVSAMVWGESEDTWIHFSPFTFPWILGMTHPLPLGFLVGNVAEIFLE